MPNRLKDFKNYSKGCQLEFTTLEKGMPTRVHNARNGNANLSSPQWKRGMPTIAKIHKFWLSRTRKKKVGLELLLRELKIHQNWKTTMTTNKKCYVEGAKP